MNEKVNTEHDLGYKSLLRHKKTFIEFLRDFVRKDWVKEIKEENLILIDKEFILRDFKEEESDIVYKVNIDGKEIIFYVLLELQSKVDYSMPIRLFMYMSEIWRYELKNTDEKKIKRKSYRLPAIIPIVVYNGKNNWTVAKTFKEVLSGYELFEENIIDFKYMLYDINRMDTGELFEIASIISSVFSLDQANIDDEEIVRRLKVIGRFINRKSTKEQLILFKEWIMGILSKRYDENASEDMIDIINNISEMEVKDMVSNLGKNLEESINKKLSKVEKNKAIEIAKNLLDVLDEETISKKTGLTIEEVKGLMTSRS